MPMQFFHILLNNLQKCLEKIYFTLDINKGKYETPCFFPTPFVKIVKYTKKHPRVIIATPPPITNRVDTKCIVLCVFEFVFVRVYFYKNNLKFGSAQKTASRRSSFKESETNSGTHTHTQKHKHIGVSRVAPATKNYHFIFLLKSPLIIQSNLDFF